MWTYRAALVRAIDADSLILRVDLGFQVESKVRVRLADPDIDAPERHTVAGRAAAIRVRELLTRLPGEFPLTIRTEYEKTFDRFVAQVLLPDGSNLAQVLLDEGLARPWVAG